MVVRLCMRVGIIRVCFCDADALTISCFALSSSTKARPATPPVAETRSANLFVFLGIRVGVCVCVYAVCVCVFVIHYHMYSYARSEAHTHTRTQGHH